MTAHTLRYYEKEGLIQPMRDKNDRRLYTEEHLLWLRFVTKMKQSHMPLAKIKMYGELYQQGDVSVAGRRQLLQEHCEMIQAEIAALQAIEVFLVAKISRYDKKYNSTRK